MTERRRPTRETGPHIPPTWEPHIATAFQALERGEAEAYQQRAALEWLIGLTGFYDLSYRPGDAGATAFAEGKRFIGTQIHKMLIVNARAFTKEG